MISCANHDYVEIACMYHFKVKLYLKNSRIVEGKALQTTYDENKEEGIILETEIGKQEIVLERVASMEAVRKNPHFDKINFS